MPISHGGYRPPDPGPGGFAPPNPSSSESLIANQPDGVGTANLVSSGGGIGNLAATESSDKIRIRLSFKLAKTDGDGKPIEDSFPSNKFGRYISAVQDLQYLEYGDGEDSDPTFSYCPERRLELQVEKVTLPNDQGLLLYNVQVPLPSDIASSNEQEFFERYQTYACVRNLFVLTIESSQIPQNKVDSAINNLGTIQKILELNFEDDESTK